MTDDDALISRLQKRCHGCYADPSPCVICEAAARIAALTAELAELDPPPEHCGCREAQCPHLPIRKQSRKELGEHWRKMIALERGRATKAEAALAERDKDAERYRWLREASLRRTPEHDYYAKIDRWSVSVENGGIGHSFCMEKLDAAIDAAIRESKEKP